MKLDLKNAFNTVKRDAMLTEVRNKTKQLYHYLRQCYLNPTYLAFGNKLILSRVGAHPMVTKLNTELNIWYLDDGAIGYLPEKVCDNLALIKSTAKELGLELNGEKCELFPNGSQLNNDTIQEFRNLPPGIRMVPESELELLGSPLAESG